MTERAAASASGTVARAIRVLAAVIDEGRPVGVQTVGETTGLPTSTTHRLLTLLAEEGMVDRDPVSHLYRVGAEGYRLASRTIETVGLDRVVQPVLDDLARQFDESVLFGLYSAPTRSFAFLARADGHHLLQYRIDLHAPSSLLWGASGRVVSAYLDDETLAGVVAVETADRTGRLAAADGSPTPSVESLAPELREIRDRGYAVSEGQKLPRARGIAVPVHGPRHVVGSLTLTHPHDRTPHGDLPAIVEGLKAGAERIARYLGAGHATTPGEVVR